MLKVCLVDEVMVKVMFNSLRKQPTFFVVTFKQGSYRSWKTWKVMNLRISFSGLQSQIETRNNKDI